MHWYRFVCNLVQSMYFCHQLYQTCVATRYTAIHRKSICGIDQCLQNLTMLESCHTFVSVCLQLGTSFSRQPYYSRTCLGRPLVWATTRLGRPQSPARIVSNNNVPGVSDHLPDATLDRSFGLTNDSFTCYERPDHANRGNFRQ